MMVSLWPFRCDWTPTPVIFYHWLCWMELMQLESKNIWKTRGSLSLPQKTKPLP